MLESMITNPSPTRAEVNDVANAIYDGTDAVMLSGETANGKFPVEAAQCMARIAEKADAAVNQILAHTSEGVLTQAEAIGQAVAQMVKPLNIKRILCFTQSGYSARAIARYRPDAPITAFTLSEETRRRCALYWGVDAAGVIEVCSTDAMLELADEVLLEENLGEYGDNIIIIAGTPLAVGSVTNLLKLHTVGDKY
jgi:pyruvate kinase